MIINRPNLDFRLFYLISYKVSLIFLKLLGEIDVYICQCEQYCSSFINWENRKDSPLNTQCSQYWSIYA